MAKSLKIKSSTQAQSAMALLLAKHEKDVIGLKKGESVTGKITKLTPNEILVDVGAKTDALVLEKEKKILKNILERFNVGDTVTVSVLNPESEYGHPVVSLRRYLSELAWKNLESLEKNKEEITGTVQEVTKAGYLIATDFGISGFLPQSHTLSGDIKAGQAVQVTVLELNKKENKIIFSQKPALTAEDFAKATKGLKEGDKVQATITNVSSFGLFATITVKEQVLEAFIHISEISWEKVLDLSTMFTSGQTVEAVIVRVDTDTQRVNLSIKRLTADPFETRMKTYPVDKKVRAEVTKVEESGVTVLLEGAGDFNDVEAFIKKEKIPPTTMYTVGQEITVTVSEFDKRKHRIVVVPVLLEKPLMYR